jgi:hypothetical protein
MASASASNHSSGGWAAPIKSCCCMIDFWPNSVEAQALAVHRPLRIQLQPLKPEQHKHRSRTRPGSQLHCLGQPCYLLCHQLRLYHRRLGQPEPRIGAIFTMKAMRLANTATTHLITKIVMTNIKNGVIIQFFATPLFFKDAEW